MQYRPSLPDTPAQLLAIPDGVAGTRETLRLMKRLVLDGKKSMAIRNKALSLIAHLPPKDYVGQARAIFQFVRDRIRYVHDIAGIETLTEPATLLEVGQGDCDDKATLVCALLQSVGHPCRLVAVAIDGAPDFSHVYAETRIGQRWVGLETTEDWPMGAVSPRISKRMHVHI